MLLSGRPTLRPRAQSRVMPMVIVIGADHAGFSLKEALATGLPSIATYHAGTPEVITPFYSGLLVPERDVTALVNAITFYIENPEQAKNYGKEASNIIYTQHNLTTLNKYFEKIIEYIINAVDDLLCAFRVFCGSRSRCSE